jgi:hypothetical protein
VPALVCRGVEVARGLAQNYDPVDDESLWSVGRIARVKARALERLNGSEIKYIK